MREEKEKYNRKDPTGIANTSSVLRCVTDLLSKEGGVVPSGVVGVVGVGVVGVVGMSISGWLC